MVSLRSGVCIAQIAVMDVPRPPDACETRISMNAPMTKTTFAAFALMASLSATVRAQDVPGIEICTVEKTMERRSSCLQSNVDFLQKTINKLTADHQQKIEASNRQIEALKGAVVGLQKVVSELQAAQKAAEDAKKAASPVAKDAAPAKDGTK
jgi:TolA-binding protein